MPGELYGNFVGTVGQIAHEEEVEGDPAAFDVDNTNAHHELYTAPNTPFATEKVADILSDGTDGGLDEYRPT